MYSHDKLLGVRALERKLKRVQNWIERCIQAYRNGKYMYAVSELESARAELEAARLKLWEEATKAESSTGKARFSYFVSFGSRSLCLALLILMVAALPTATMRNFPLPVVKEDNLSLEWVTSDERSALVALRKSLSEMNLRASAVERSDVKVKARPASITVREELSSNKEEGSVLGAQKAEKNSLNIEDVLYLYEVGQRALRKEDIRIK